MDSLRLTMGMAMILILYAMSQNQKGYNNKSEKHPVMRFFAWVFSCLGILGLAGYLWSLISADTTAGVITFNPAILTCFGLAAYLFNYNLTKLKRSMRFKRVLYILALIFSFHSLWKSEEILSYGSIIFTVLTFYGFRNFVDPMTNLLKKLPKK